MKALKCSKIPFSFKGKRITPSWFSTNYFTDQFAVTIYKYQQVWFWPCSQGRILFKANQERCLSEKKHAHATLTQIEDATKQMKERVSVL